MVAPREPGAWSDPRAGQGRIWGRIWGRALGLALASAVALSGCSGTANPGGFEDDGEESETESPPLPDLPQPECSPTKLDACDEGFKCSYVVDALGPTNRCVPILGDKQAGEGCEQIEDSDDCDLGHLCWGTEADGSAGICVAFCTVQLSCGDEDHVCSMSTNDLLPLCLERCHPLDADPGCPEGWGCYPDPDKRWSCDRDRSGEAGVHGDPCECLNCCDPGLMCAAGKLVDAEGCGEGGAVGCCAQICDRMDGMPLDDACPTESESCRAFYSQNNLLLGYEQVGICEL
ncbi:hypothetical protein [Plesiocystis pacifica]|uniref:hypothetical protein n=1 Tax=Plesiocystis pacifica TaxID=191768 RepID=UPI0012FA2D03|nr:hypothetical protein [Plesiocystis pacifica]